jgi:hypothetical protein
VNRATANRGPSDGIVALIAPTRVAIGVDVCTRFVHSGQKEFHAKVIPLQGIINKHYDLLAETRVSSVVRLEIQPTGSQYGLLSPGRSGVRVSGPQVFCKGCDFTSRPT